MRAIVFAKAPLAGRAKTRLAAAIGPERAAALAQAFIHDTLASLTDFDVELHAADAPVDPFFEALNVRVAIQRGQGLGERMQHALAGAAAPAIVVGTDAPSIPAALLRSAFVGLDAADLVFIPVADGGFAAVAASGALPAAVLSDPAIRYSSRHALADSLRIAAQRGVRVRLTEPWFDVDVSEDLHVLAAHLSLRPSAAPRSAALLRAWDVRSF